MQLHQSRWHTRVARRARYRTLVTIVEPQEPKGGHQGWLQQSWRREGTTSRMARGSKLEAR